MKQSRINSCSVSKASLNFNDDVYPIILKKARAVFYTKKGRGFYELDDLISEAATKAWKNWGGYDPKKSPLDAWVHMVVNTTWLDLLEKEARRGEHFTPITHTNEEGDEYELVEDSDFDDFQYATRPEMEVSENVEYIMDKVKSLPNDYQRKAMLLSIDGYDNEEIAEELGCTKENVATYLCRARKNLECLRNTYPGSRRKGE